MNDGSQDKKELREKAERLKQAFDEYLHELGVLRKERRELIESVIKRIEKDKMDAIMKDLNAS
jgi:hypothetical protein